MDAQALIIWLIVGGVAGFLAGMVVKETVSPAGSLSRRIHPAPSEHAE
jgi:uncharacterized membrane protein YeaQ/YmgE (transglycosylase-associated protein family)